MYELWYDYIKPKYGDRAKLCYADSDPKIFLKIFPMLLTDRKRKNNDINFLLDQKHMHT